MVHYTPSGRHRVATTVQTWAGKARSNAKERSVVVRSRMMESSVMLLARCFGDSIGQLEKDSKTAADLPNAWASRWKQEEDDDLYILALVHLLKTMARLVPNSAGLDQLVPPAAKAFFAKAVVEGHMSTYVEKPPRFGSWSFRLRLLPVYAQNL